MRADDAACEFASRIQERIRMLQARWRTCSAHIPRSYCIDPADIGIFIHTIYS